MKMRMRDRLWLAVTGQPWFTERRASVEFGPPIAVRTGVAYSELPDGELRHLSPQELLTREDARP